MSQPTTEELRELSLFVLNRLRQAGYTAFWAGGCVRDLLLRKVPKDYDVATDATPEQVRKLFRRTVRVGESFGVVRVNDGPNRDIEVATFRTDASYSDGRRPDSVTFSTPEMDAKRRDFTINGMFYDPISERVYDYVGGQADIESKIIRAIGDPVQRFSEDKLRLMRAVRFTASLDFEMDPVTGAAVHDMAPSVTVVSAERIRAELENMLTAPTRVRALQMLREYGLADHVFGDLGATILDPEKGAIIEGVLGALPDQATFPVVLASLLIESPDQEILAKAESLCLRLRCSNEERQRTGWLLRCRHDLDAGAGIAMAVLKRRLAHPGRAELFDFCEAVHCARFGTGVKIEECRRLAEILSPETIDPIPLLTGNDLIAMGMKPGPHFQPILEQVRDEQLNGMVHTREEAITLARRLAAKG